MKITYINHSGFLVETNDCYYVFDYYKGEMPRLDKSKEVIVFCSHFHQDHFNPKIFQILDDIGANYQAVLAKDISKKKYPTGVKIRRLITIKPTFLTTAHKLVRFFQPTAVLLLSSRQTRA